VPKFREQIKAGGPITITHPEITRYFMTIPEAAQLVIQASAFMNTHKEGALVYLLDMGESVRIVDLAKSMVQLSGMQVRDADQPHGDIDIQFVGLRPGEKLYEELLISGEALNTAHPKIRVSADQSPTRAQQTLASITALCKAEPTMTELQQALQALNTDYKPAPV
jgi:FlaA1/EpsC-like NDP-sugar epimerase